MNVTLTVYTFFENVALMVGWIVNNAIWDVLTKTMIAALPFLMLILREWYLVRREGEDEGNKGLLALNRIETGLYAMLVIYAFCVFPLMTVQFAPADVDTAYQNKCDVRVITGTSGTGAATLGGKTAQMPVWWAVVHSLSTGLTNAMVASLPCEPDYQYMRTQLNNSAISDPALRRQVAHFQNWCYGGARSKLFRDNGSISDALADKTDWLGSKYFLNTPGYYDSLQAQAPIKGFAYDPDRDFGRGTVPSQGGYPMCKEWWSASGIGLHDRLRDELDPSFWQYFKGIFPGADAEEYAIRGLLNHQSGTANGNSGVPTAGAAGGGAGGDWLSSVFGHVGGFIGVMMGNIPAEGMSDVSARAVPMVQYLVMMAIVIGMPFILVFSGYGIKATAMLTFAYFGATTLTFWFQLTRWLQDHLVSLVYGSEAAKLGFISSLTGAYDQGVLYLVEAVMIFIFPVVWMGMISWAGYGVGTAITNAMSQGTGEAKSAGKQGGSMAQAPATKAAGRGADKAAKHITGD